MATDRLGACLLWIPHSCGQKRRKGGTLELHVGLFSDPEWANFISGRLLNVLMA
jgi:hypothetical protein